jgi:hypothetical protein
MVGAAGIELPNVAGASGVSLSVPSGVVTQTCAVTAAWADPVVADAVVADAVVADAVTAGAAVAGRPAVAAVVAPAAARAVPSEAAMSLIRAIVAFPSCNKMKQIRNLVCGLANQWIPCMSRFLRDLRLANVKQDRVTGG